MDYKLKTDNILIIDNMVTGDVWYHPFINEICQNELESSESGHYHGPLVRVWLTEDDSEKGGVYVVAKLTSEAYDTVLSAFNWKFKGVLDPSELPLDQPKEVIDSTVSDYLSEIVVMLKEDVWTPGGEQFCFTDFGQKIPNQLEHVKFISYDLGLYKNDDGTWGWDS